jgi:YfiH family protein
VVAGYAPMWDAPAWVGAWMTTREGGQGVPPYDGFNLADHVGDDPAVVAQHRAQLAAHVQRPLALLRQVHGHAVCQRGLHNLSQQPQADAQFTRERGLALAIGVADCLPVLWAHRQVPVVAASHAGWRGLAAGVLERTLAHMAQAIGQTPEACAAQCAVWLGPCIGPTAFEVGAEVVNALQPMPPAVGTPHPARPGRWLLNLPALARQRLQRLGVAQPQGNDGSDPWCTVGNRARYFSHRRDGTAQGGTGRMLACVWLG